MAPDRYTELFFLNEATALAAGHRPCFECRRARFLAYRVAWATGNLGTVPPNQVRVATIDDRLHEQRAGPGRSKRTFRATLDELPDGVIVTMGQEDDRPYLLWDGHIIAWSPGGYTSGCPSPAGEEVIVLTPPSTAAVFRAGYVPEIHPLAVSPSRACRRTDLVRNIRR